MRTKSAAIITTLATAATLACAGCLVSTERTVRTEGRPVADSAMSSFEAGVTTEATMLDLMGTPSRTMVADGGGTIYVWSWRREDRGGGRVFLVFSGEHDRTHERTASVLVRNGLVERWWIDPDPNA
jgi:hypothetical protein